MYSFTIIAVVFWLFLASAVIFPVIYAYKTRHAAMDVIRAAIERGQELTPEVVRQLSNSDDKEIHSVNLKIAGAIVMACGVGTAAVATIFLFVIPAAAPFVYAGAALAFCIGGGLHYGAKILKAHEQEQKSNNTVA